MLTSPPEPRAVWPLAARATLVLALASLGVPFIAHAGGQRQTTSSGPGRPAPASSASGSAAISGIVTDATTSEPLEGVVVSLGRLSSGGLSQARATLPSVTTDDRGRFVFVHLAPSDSYVLFASRVGYADSGYGGKSDTVPAWPTDLTKITVGDGQWVKNLQLPLHRLGAISGRVVDERGEPVVGVLVRVLTGHFIAGQRQWVVGDMTMTDDRGAYRIPNLAAADYLIALLSVQSTVLDTTPEKPATVAVGQLPAISAFVQGPSALTGPAVDVDGRHRLAMTSFATPPPPSAAPSRAYPPLFYPDARTIAAAEPVALRTGQSRAGVDFSLRPVPAARVSGRVEGTDRPPAYLLRLMPVGSERLGFGAEAATTLLEPDGSFTFLNVPEGEYTLLARADVAEYSTTQDTGMPDAPGFPFFGLTTNDQGDLAYHTRSGPPAGLWGQASLAVAGRDLTNLVVPLHHAVTISGRVVYPAGMSPPPGRGNPVQLAAGNGDPVTDLGRLGTPSTETFRFEGLVPNRYFVTLTSRLQVVSVIVDGRDLRDTGLDASLGQEFSDVVVTVTDRTATLAGTVREAPAGALVIAFPTESALWQGHGDTPPRLSSTHASTAGAFSLDRLSAGDYCVVAVDPTLVNPWSDPRFLAAAAKMATRVSLDWSDQKTISLSLTVVRVP